MRYKVIKSVRENICLEVGAGRVTVRAPQALRRRDIRAYVKENEDWIRQKLKEYPRGLKGRRLKEEDLDLLTSRANEVFSQVVREFSAITLSTFTTKRINGDISEAETCISTACF